MIHFTKKFYAIIFGIFCMSQVMQSSDMRDQDGRTELMNYVIQIEKEIKSKKSKLDKLCEKYFTWNQKTKILEKRVWSTDEDVIQYRKFEDEYDRLIEETIENIKIMVSTGADLQARDLQGNSVSDYCYTHKIYDALRTLGAPAALFETAVKGIIIVTVGIMIATACYRIYFPR